MTVNVIVVDQLRGDILKKSMAEIHADPRKIPQSHYSVEVEPGVAMLVEPVNADPYVFVPPNVVHEFVSEPASGTDKIRQRMLAGVFFLQLVDAAKAAASHASAAAAEPVASELSPAVRSEPRAKRMRA